MSTIQKPSKLYYRSNISRHSISSVSFSPDSSLLAVGLIGGGLLIWMYEGNGELKSSLKDGKPSHIARRLTLVCELSLPSASLYTNLRHSAENNLRARSFDELKANESSQHFNNSITTNMKMKLLEQVNSSIELWKSEGGSFSILKGLSGNSGSSSGDVFNLIWSEGCGQFILIALSLDGILCVWSLNALVMELISRRKSDKSDNNFLEEKIKQPSLKSHLGELVLLVGVLSCGEKLHNINDRHKKRSSLFYNAPSHLSYSPHSGYITILWQKNLSVIKLRKSGIEAAYMCAVDIKMVSDQCLLHGFDSNINNDTLFSNELVSSSSTSLSRLVFVPQIPTLKFLQVDAVQSTAKISVSPALHIVNAEEKSLDVLSKFVFGFWNEKERAFCAISENYGVKKFKVVPKFKVQNSSPTNDENTHAGKNNKAPQGCFNKLFSCFGCRSESESVQSPSPELHRIAPYQESNESIRELSISSYDGSRANRSKHEIAKLFPLDSRLKRGYLPEVLLWPSSSEFDDLPSKNISNVKQLSTPAFQVKRNMNELIEVDDRIDELDNKVQNKFLDLSLQSKTQMSSLPSSLPNTIYPPISVPSFSPSLEFQPPTVQNISVPASPPERHVKLTDIGLIKTNPDEIVGSFEKNKKEITSSFGTTAPSSNSFFNQPPFIVGPTPMKAPEKVSIVTGLPPLPLPFLPLLQPQTLDPLLPLPESNTSIDKMQSPPENEEDDIFFIKKSRLEGLSRLNANNHAWGGGNMGNNNLLANPFNFAILLPQTETISDEKTISNVKTHHPFLGDIPIFLPSMNT